MEWRRKIKLMMIWSTLTAALIAGFWEIWVLITGVIPATQLFAISRWWDILLGPIFSTATILIITSKKAQEDDLPGFNSLAIGTVSGLVIGLLHGLIAGVMVCSFFYLVAVIIYLFSEAPRKKIKKFLFAEE